MFGLVDLFVCCGVLLWVCFVVDDVLFVMQVVCVVVGFCYYDCLLGLLRLGLVGLVVWMFGVCCCFVDLRLMGWFSLFVGLLGWFVFAWIFLICGCLIGA